MLTMQQTDLDNGSDDGMFEANEHMLEAEVEYVLDELQQIAYKIFDENCVPALNARLAGIASQRTDRRQWFRDMAETVLLMMSLMETHGYQLSEEILDVLAQWKKTGPAKAKAGRQQ